MVTTIIVTTIKIKQIREKFISDIIVISFNVKGHQ